MAKISKHITIANPACKYAVIYARVSSKEQEKEGFSIPAQLKSLLKEYSAAQGYNGGRRNTWTWNGQADWPHRLW